MLKFIAVAIFALLTVDTAVAAPASCPVFPYDLSEDEGVVELRSFSVDEQTSLTALQANQVIQTARWFKGDFKTVDPEPMPLAEAITLLTNASEGGDLYFTFFRFQNVVYTSVTAYPGGNPYGIVFKGTSALAERTDGDLTCI